MNTEMEKFAFTIELTALSREDAEEALKIIARLGEPFGMELPAN